MINATYLALMDIKEATFEDRIMAKIVFDLVYSGLSFDDAYREARHIVRDFLDQDPPVPIGFEIEYTVMDVKIKIRRTDGEKNRKLTDKAVSEALAGAGVQPLGG